MEANKTVVQSKSGIQYLVTEILEDGMVWGTVIRGGRFAGGSRRINPTNVKAIGTATVTREGQASLITIDEVA